MTSDALKISYEFRCDDGDRKLFTIRLDPKSLSLIRNPVKEHPNWTRLEHEQCKCCTLETADHPFCPAAVNIAEVVEEFKERASTQECKVRCTGPERTYYKKTTLAEGLYSLLGVIIPVSGCPVMAFLKPMARFHLPFSTGEEATVRSTAFFLLGHYLRDGARKSAGEAIELLNAHYGRVKMVNEGLFARVTHVADQDADKNAIVMLHALSQLLSMEIDSRLGSIAELFRNG